MSAYIVLEGLIVSRNRFYLCVTLLFLGGFIFSVSNAFSQSSQLGSISGEITHPIMRRYMGAVFIGEIDGIQFNADENQPVMDQVNLRFTPHVLPVLQGSTVQFPNSDEIRHHVYTSTSSVCQFELGVYEAGIVKEQKCDTPGLITLLCNVHAEMKGFIIVSPTPHFSTTDRNGSFRIEAVPEGTYTLHFEHERLMVDPITVHVIPDQETEVDFGKPRRRKP